VKHCRTKTGELRLRHEGKDFLLDGNGSDLPDELAESIRSHVNVVVEEVERMAHSRSVRRPKDADEAGEGSVSWLDLAEQVQQATRAVFAEPATYTPPLGSPVAITGEYDAAAVQVELEGGVAVQTVGPRIAVLLSELPGSAAAIGAGVVVRGISYTVTEIEPDGHGMALLRLRRV